MRRGWLGPGMPGSVFWLESVNRRRPGTVSEKIGPNPVKKAETLLFGRNKELSLLYQEKGV